MEEFQEERKWNYWYLLIILINLAFIIFIHQYFSQIS